MKKIKYLGGGWTDKNTKDPHIFKLTVGKVYDVIEEDHHYGVKSDTSDNTVYEYKHLFSVEGEVIHHPSEIKVGKLYQSIQLGEDYLYMGCRNNDTNEKFLVIVVDDTCDYDSYVGVMVSMDLTMPIWKNGFVEKS